MKRSLGLVTAVQLYIVTYKSQILIETAFIFQSTFSNQVLIFVIWFSIHYKLSPIGTRKDSQAPRLYSIRHD